MCTCVCFKAIFTNVIVCVIEDSLENEEVESEESDEDEKLISMVSGWDVIVRYPCGVHPMMI